MRGALLGSLILLAGCGAAPLPPPAGPQPPAVRFAGRTARLDVRTRTLQLGGARVAAGVGPTAIAAGKDRLYVTDKVQGALLIFDTEPELELQRRVYLPGEPSAVTVDRPRGRVWVTLTARDEVVELSADGAAKLRGRYPTVRAPDRIRVAAATGAVTVGGADGARQVLDRRIR